ncbi:MAG: C1 family peptidase [Cyanothece sp. SIO1E1]|nr:C1 family peptidase [Cyanothece sp. SIO1E1]
MHEFKTGWKNSGYTNKQGRPDIKISQAIEDKRIKLATNLIEFLNSRKDVSSTREAELIQEIENKIYEEMKSEKILSAAILLEDNNHDLDALKTDNLYFEAPEILKQLIKQELFPDLDLGLISQLENSIGIIIEQFSDLLALNLMDKSNPLDSISDSYISLIISPIVDFIFQSCSPLANYAAAKDLQAVVHQNLEAFQQLIHTKDATQNEWMMQLACSANSKVIDIVSRLKAGAKENTKVFQNPLIHKPLIRLIEHIEAGLIKNNLINFSLNEKNLPSQTLLQLSGNQNTLHQNSILIPMTWETKQYFVDGDREIFACLPPHVDLSDQCSSVKHQGQLQSCTAFAGTALIEFLNNRKEIAEKHTNVSALFLYRTTLEFERKEAGGATPPGDNGASMRNTMRAIAEFGMPPEHDWPYPKLGDDEITALKQDPKPLCYQYTRNYQSIKYFRLDPDENMSTRLLLGQVKAILAAGLPCMFAVSAYKALIDDSLTQPQSTGDIPYRQASDENGHALVAVGYDDNHRLSSHTNDRSLTGALLVRNSWGVEWGDGGYGWLPYQYVLENRTADWWSLLDWQWMDDAAFGVKSRDQQLSKLGAPNVRGRKSSSGSRS